MLVQPTLIGEGGADDKQGPDGDDDDLDNYTRRRPFGVLRSTNWQHATVVYDTRNGFHSVVSHLR